ncbi:conserved protein of unknown function [Xenorhabdus nematophila AN6/1]|nr:hypothetical protein [Xenorhabdus nematophila]CEK24127.1 conserved protein of unknown function [Xenorhabdus nematophila AN6/1]
MEKDPTLKQNLKTKANKKAIEKGKAPFVRKKDQVGGRKKLELHHIAAILRHFVTQPTIIFD